MLLQILQTFLSRCALSLFSFNLGWYWWKDFGGFRREFSPDLNHTAGRRIHCLSLLEGLIPYGLLTPSKCGREGRNLKKNQKKTIKKDQRISHKHHWKVSLSVGSLGSIHTTQIPKKNANILYLLSFHVIVSFPVSYLSGCLHFPVKYLVICFNNVYQAN